MTLKDRNVYEDFDVETDILFFKVGSLGLVIFHGSNYNIKKRMSAEEINRLIGSGTFQPAGSDCYVNIGKISAIEEGTVYFGGRGPDHKRLPVSRWRVHSLRTRLTTHGGKQAQ
ncbi:hypothetical protein [Paenibacillus beijingensis]|uniref:HTH LytTR-type domain-containing protein n=1 Tax=Paenibacillus beijingensis TaxID=1126833 RepID=A0A0D5NQA6_9BACL|nr:hypothetical protein [Paenibacillus beijingensis]AJY77504.1 hypothetical protein VN24_04635 [Paenibacillus beijingensis]